MPLANLALVLVTDGRKTLLFRNHGDVNQIDLRTEAHDERADAKDSDMKTDAAGSNQQSGGYGRPSYEETDFHQLDEDRWATGDSRWGARHRGRVYLFHDAASQQRFMGDPERYSPALAGFDPVVFSEHGQFVEGKREHGLRFENQMFLFNSEESLAKFEKNPDAYAGQVRQAVLGSTQYR